MLMLIVCTVITDTLRLDCSAVVDSQVAYHSTSSETRNYHARS